MALLKKVISRIGVMYGISMANVVIIFPYSANTYLQLGLANVNKAQSSGYENKRVT